MRRLSNPSKAAAPIGKFLAWSTAGLVLAGCASLTAVGTEPIDSRYSVDGGEWNWGVGITVVARSFERNGVAVVCGAWTVDHQRGLTYTRNYDVMEAASVFVGGDRVVQNLSFMRQVPYSDNIAGEQANCVATDRLWKADYDTAVTRVRIPRMAFPLDAERGEYEVFRERRRARIIR